MNSSIRPLVLAAALGLVALACSTDAEHGAVAAKTPSAKTTTSLAPFQSELLNLAFDSASRFPTVPHVKNRSRAQERIVLASLELEQPDLAVAFADGITNWREGMGYADCAYFLVEAGDRSPLVKEYLKKASAVADANGEDEGDGQAWRAERIYLRIAMTYFLLGDLKSAETYIAKVPPTEAAKLTVLKVRNMDREQIFQQFETMDEIVAAKDTGRAGNMVAVCRELYELHFDDDAIRETSVNMIDSALGAVPLQTRIELWMDMADIAMERGKPEVAKPLIANAEASLTSFKWPTKDHVPLYSRLAELLYRSGEREKALTEIENTLTWFEYEKSNGQIFGIYQAACLRALAEAYLVAEKPDRALEMYKACVEQGADNPNARPRCDDLVDTCCSLAVHEFEPDEELKARLIEISEGLTEPW